MQASFSPTEQELIDRLKDKYAGLKESNNCDREAGSCGQCVAIASDAGHRPSGHSGQPTRGSNVDASVCSHCQGVGTITEIYNHRRLENYCQHCNGRGVHVYKNGVEVKETASTSSATSSGTTRGPSGVIELHSRIASGADGGREADGEPSNDQAATLQRDLQRIAAKAAAYTKERLDALAILQQPAGSGSSGGSVDVQGREQAVRDLVAQLDVQLERLELARRRKQAQLAKLGPGAPAAAAAAATVTLDDIIANEGVRS